MFISVYATAPYLRTNFSLSNHFRHIGLVSPHGKAHDLPQLNPSDGNFISFRLREIQGEIL